jgi:NDP-sugar pyrophosphorylase family protein
MKAMVLAAGLGTRLGELTRDRPKALVSIDGRTLLETVLRRLEQEGFSEIVVNAHHHAGQIARFLEDFQPSFGPILHLSLEKTLLDTGGALLHARGWLEGEEAFLVHNVDVLSDLPLAQLVNLARSGEAPAVLAVKERTSTRQLLFDAADRLIGKRSPSGDTLAKDIRPDLPIPLAFCGVHAARGDFLKRIRRTGAFGIVDAYLDEAAAGRQPVAFRADEYRWKDVGRPEHLAPLRQDGRDA